jgi:O-antigen ligase
MVMLFVVGGLAMTWKEIRLLFYTIAAAAIVNLGTAQLFAKLDNGGRIKLEASGSMGNSNDLAAQFLLVLPFLVFVAMDRARNTFLRIALLPPLAYGAWVVLGTGSRGCMIALGAMFLFALWRASPAHRIVTLVAGIGLAVMIPLFLPGNVLTRLGSLLNEEGAISDNPGETSEALASSSARAYLLKQSLLYTFQHPVFGVGPGQFSNYEGNEKTAEGKHGQWHATHNFLTQVSSECGIPALILMLLGLISAILLVNRTYWMARRKGFRDVANACFCFELAMVGYLCSIVFLAQAYGFYLPTMVGLAIAMSMVAMREMSAQEKSAVALPFAVR